MYVNECYKLFKKTNWRFFIVSVGLPILAIAGVAKAGGLHVLASRVHPGFAFDSKYLCI